MEKLVLNDGTILENSYCANDLDNLYLYIGNGMNIVQLAVLLTAERTISITEEVGERQRIFSGYTNVIGINQGVSLVSVVLKR